jgi:hypothetical protein
MSYMRFYFRSMVKDAPDRDASITAESSVAEAFSPVRSWDLGYYAFYPVGQVIQTKGPDSERRNDGTEEVFSGATGN